MTRYPCAARLGGAAAALLTAATLGAPAAHARDGDALEPIETRKSYDEDIAIVSDLTVEGTDERVAWADHAGHAQHADHADEADHADHASEADHADTASHADSASEAETLSAGTCSPRDVLRKGEAEWECVPEGDLRPDHAQTADEAENATHAETADRALEADTLSPDVCEVGDVLQKLDGAWVCVPAVSLVSAVTGMPPSSGIYRIRVEHELDPIWQPQSFAASCDDPHDTVLSGGCELFPGYEPSALLAEASEDPELAASVGGIRVMGSHPVPPAGSASGEWRCQISVDQEALQSWIPLDPTLSVSVTCLDVPAVP